LDAPVVLVFELVLRRVRRRITPLPELLDELVALGVVAQFLERGELFVSDDPAYVFVDPFLVNAAELFFGSVLVVLARTFQRILILSGLGLSGGLFFGLVVGLSRCCLAGFLRMQYETTKNKDSTNYKKISKPG